jgi:hypothetical protein
MTLIPAGNVGIGTTNPGRKLEVLEGNVQIVANFQNTSATSARIKFTDANTGAENVNIGAVGTRLALYTNNLERLSILSGGNVGIGTTTPSRRLQVTTTDDTRGIMVQQNLASSYAEIHLSASREYRIGTGGSTSDAAAANNLYIYDATAAAHRFTITSTGNVGIGTTGPASLLQVVGAAGLNNGVLNISNTYAAGGVYFPATKFRNTRGDHSFGIVSEFSIGNVGGVDRSSILFYTDDSAHSWQEGQVTSPWGTVDSFGIGYRASNTPSSFTTWPTNYFNVTPTGNVGIGTGAPSQKLQVAGIGAFGSSAEFVTIGSYLDNFSGRYSIHTTNNHGDHTIASNLAIDTNHQLYTVNSHPSMTGAAIVLGGNGYDLGANTIAFFAETPSAATANTIVSASSAEMVIKGGGNVGIGITNPTAKLHISGDVKASLANVNQVNAVMYNSGTGLFTYVGTGSIVISTATNADNIFVSEDATNANQPVLFAANTEAYYRARGDKADFFYNPATNELTAGTYIETSALKFKENIVHLTGSLHQVEKLQGISYNRIGQTHREIGLIADEVVKILPELVKYQEGQVYGLSYNRITAVLVEAVKELSDKVKQQEIFIQDLADRLKKQENKG